MRAKKKKETKMENLGTICSTSWAFHKDIRKSHETSGIQASRYNRFAVRKRTAYNASQTYDSCKAGIVLGSRAFSAWIDTSNVWHGAEAIRQTGADILTASVFFFFFSAVFVFFFLFFFLFQLLEPFYFSCGVNPRLQKDWRKIFER